MKKVTTLIAAVLIAFVSINAQNFNSKEDNKKFNKIYNGYIYIYKNVNSFIRTNNVKKIDIYANDVKIKTLTFGEISKDSKLKAFLLFTSDSTIKAVNKVRLVNSANKYKIVDIEYNDIEMLDREETENYSKNQVQYMFSTGNVAHNQGRVTMENRMDKFGIDFWGEFTEILSKDTNWKIYTTDVERSTSIIKTYFDNRFRSEHWSTITDMNVDKYATYFIQKNYIIYSITVMIDGKMK